MAEFNVKLKDLLAVSDKNKEEFGTMLSLLLSDDENKQLDNDFLKINQGKTSDSPDWVKYGNFCFNNINVSYGQKVISDKMSQSDKCELFGTLIDIVEDWLESKGITTEDIVNDDREGENAAIIYGTDYDYIADRFADILGITR